MRLYEQLIGARAGGGGAPDRPGPAPWQHVVDRRAGRAGRLRGRRGAAALRAALVPGLPPAAGVLRLPGPLPVRQAARAWRPAVRRCDAHRGRDRRCSPTRTTARWTACVSAQNFALFCTPAVNLFPRRADRIHLTESTNEYHVVPDRTRPMDFEVHSVKRGGGLRIERRGQADLPAVLRLERPDRAPATRRPTTRVAAAAAHALGAPARAAARARATSAARCSSRWSTPTRGRTGRACASSRSRPCAPTAICRCTCRSGRARTDFTLESGAPVESIRCLAGPTPPRAVARPRRHQLAPHQPPVAQLSVAGRRRDAAPARRRAALRELLSLYADLTDADDAQADRRRALDGLRRDHARAAGARADHLRPRAGGHADLRRGRLRGQRRLPAGRGAGAVLRQVRVDQFVHRDGAAHRSARRDHAMAGESGTPAGDL